jgi:O-antigen ligase
MKSETELKKSKLKETTFIYASAFLITIYINSQIQDPFNSTKFWVLLLTSSWLTGSLLKQKVYFNEKDAKFYRKLTFILIIYLTSLVISALNSYNTSVSFLGESFRRNGVLTYAGFTIFFLACAKFVRFENIYTGFKFVFLTGLLTGTYSIVQITGNDWIKWSDKNSIITTLGNSNFSGAAMALFTIVIFGQIFITSVNKIYRFASIALVPLLIFVVIKTNARQALVILILGIFLISLLLVHRFSKLVGKLSFLVGLIIGTVALFGTLQIGPLKEMLYKESVTIRGYYWRAGLEMFKNNPIFGVGIDNYGFFFKEYREFTYPLKYGFAITSSNAHNVFIQNFATGGILVGVLYTFLQLLILYKGISLVKSTQGDRRLISLVFLAVWLAFQAQSLISIDNIGISIWGWVFGGTIIGLSFTSNSTHGVSKRKSVEIDLSKILISTLSTILAMFLVVPLYYGERATYIARVFTVPQDLSQKVNFEFYLNKVLNSRFMNNDYKNITLSNAFSMGDTKKALDELSKINLTDYRNLDTLILLAEGNEKLGNYNEAIEFRLQIAKYDPWNAVNYLGLAQLYKFTNDPENSSLMVDRILSFASSDPIAEVAKKEFSFSSN